MTQLHKTSNRHLSDIRNIISQIEEKSADGEYIYRGEPEHYEKISSNLYRQYAEIEVDGFNIKIVQDEMLTEAEAFSHETDDPLDILTIASGMGIDIVTLFHRTYISLVDFEEKNDIVLPHDIKEILTTKV